MNLKPLLRNQKIRIDPHGHYETSDWDNKCYEIHLHKRTKYSINGKYCDVDIIVPLNQDTPVRWRVHNENITIPQSLYKEIKEAFADSSKRKEFIDNLRHILGQYISVRGNEEMVYDSLKRIGNAFGIDTLTNDAILQTYTTGTKYKTFYLLIRDQSEYFRISSNRYGITLQDWKY